MKYFAIALLVVLLVLPGVMAQTTMKVDAVRYEPLPAQPGQYLTVYLQLENSGNLDAPNAALEIVNQFPFTASSTQRVNLGLLRSQQRVVEDFRVRVDSAAVVGDNKLKVRYTPDGLEWQEREITIEIRPDDASLSIEQVRANPEEVLPGDAVRLEMEIKNTANVVLRNIAVQLDLVATQGSTVVDYPFIPSGTATQKIITKLNPGETETVEFSLKSYPTAAPGYYKMPVSLTYFDEQGTEGTQDEFTGIIVGASPELDIYVEGTSVRQESAEGDITLQFVNKGVNDMKFLSVEVLDSESYTVVGTQRVYIGDLDSDDFRSETFTVQSVSEDASVAVQVSYRDQNNKEYQLVKNIPIQYDQSPQESSGNTGIIVAIVVVAILGIYLWRRHRRKHKR